MVFLLYFTITKELPRLSQMTESLCRYKHTVMPACVSNMHLCHYYILGLKAVVSSTVCLIFYVIYIKAQVIISYHIEVVKNAFFTRTGCVILFHLFTSVFGTSVAQLA